LLDNACQNLLECRGGGLYPNNDHRTRLLLQACYSIQFWLKDMILTISTKDFCGEKRMAIIHKILKKLLLSFLVSIAKFG
jgi:hypothetical protein